MLRVGVGGAVYRDPKLRGAGGRGSLGKAGSFGKAGGSGRIMTHRTLERLNHWVIIAFSAAGMVVSLSDEFSYRRPADWFT